MHDETLTLPIHDHLQLHASQYKHKTQHPSHPLHKHTIYFNTPRLNKTVHNKHSHRPPHSHYNRHKNKQRHIHLSIVSRHLATRGNNKILRTPPPHISSSEEILPRLTCRTLAHLRTNKSPFLKSCLHKVDAKSHPSPTHKTHTISSTSPTYAPHCHPWICGQIPLE